MVLPRPPFSSDSLIRPFATAVSATLSRPSFEEALRTLLVSDLANPFAVNCAPPLAVRYAAPPAPAVKVDSRAVAVISTISGATLSETSWNKPYCSPKICATSRRSDWRWLASARPSLAQSAPITAGAMYSRLATESQTE